MKGKHNGSETNRPWILEILRFYREFTAVLNTLCLLGAPTPPGWPL